MIPVNMKGRERIAAVKTLWQKINYVLYIKRYLNYRPLELCLLNHWSLFPRHFKFSHSCLRVKSYGLLWRSNCLTLKIKAQAFPKRRNLFTSLRDARSNKTYRNIYLLSLWFTCRDTSEIAKSMEMHLSCDQPCMRFQVPLQGSQQPDTFRILSEINPVNALLFYFTTR